jgi:CO dehydrogenase nickel-insertion accessory protein CooC1
MSEDPGLPGVLAAREIVIVCGSGGVGKTSVAGAAAAMAAAEQGSRVLVLTIDPARRLATALGPPHAVRTCVKTKRQPRRIVFIFPSICEFVSARP